MLWRCESAKQCLASKNLRREDAKKIRQGDDESNGYFKTRKERENYDS